MNQLAIDFVAPLQASGRELRDAGIERARSAADRKTLGWSETAFGYLLEFLASHAEAFRGEEVREFAHAKGCPHPAHARAWGSVLMRAARENKIEKIGTVQVKNPAAHMANANLWKRVMR